MSFTADNMAEQNYPKPHFVVQADNTESFGNISHEIIDLITDKLETNEECKPIKNNDSESSTSLTSLVEMKSADYCDKKMTFANLELFKKEFEEKTWSPEIIELFDVEILTIENSVNIPNEKEIGRWLVNERGQHNYFYSPYYTFERYIEKEYVKHPKKPISNTSTPTSIFARIHSIYDNDKFDYVLEDVKKNKQILSGIKLMVESPFKGFEILFKPKHPAVENYILTFFLLFSRTKLEIFSSSEVLWYTDWENCSKPNCLNWKIDSVKLSDIESIKETAGEIISRAQDFIIQDITNKIND